MNRDPMIHALARDRDEHTQAFTDAGERHQRRHLDVAHHRHIDSLPAEVERLKRDQPDTYAVREPTLLDVHNWWHAHQPVEFGELAPELGDPHAYCDPGGRAGKQVRCDRCGERYVVTPRRDFYCAADGDHCCEPRLTGDQPLTHIVLIPTTDGGTS